MSPAQSFLRALPGSELQGFVDALQPGLYRWSDLWEHFNGRRGFDGSGPVFRYALVKAGMEKVSGRAFRKTE